MSVLSLMMLGYDNTFAFDSMPSSHVVYVVSRLADAGRCALLFESNIGQDPEAVVHIVHALVVCAAQTLVVQRHNCL